MDIISSPLMPLLFTATHLTKNFAGTRTDEPFRLAVVPGNIEVGPLYLLQPLEPELAQFEMVDGKRKNTPPAFGWTKAPLPASFF